MLIVIKTLYILEFMVLGFVCSVVQKEKFMNNQKNSGYGSFYFFGTFTIILTVLRLFDLIDIAWWSWNPFKLSVLIVQVWSLYTVILLGFFALIIVIIDRSRKK